MNTMTRLILAALLAFGLPLSAKPPPKGEDWGTIQLVKTGDEPQASGVATLNNVKWNMIWYDSTEFMRGYDASLTVQCQNLTPGATYSTPAGTFKADGKGRGKVTGDVSFVVIWEITWWGEIILWGDIILPYEVEVVRVNPDGTSTPVLTGSFVPPE